MAIWSCVKVAVISR